MDNFIFTSESVCAGHPDKIADSISDAIVDAVIENNPQGRCAVETLVTTNRVVLAGEVRTNKEINFGEIAKREIKRLGYNDPSLSFCATSPIDIFIHSQSDEIARGVDLKGAGDQGMMFGFACRDSTSFMPLPITIAHALVKRIDEVRGKNILPYLFPDGKAQVSVLYKKGQPYKITSLVIAAPHRTGLKLEEVKDDVYEQVVKKVLSQFSFEIHKKDFIFNGTGVWHRGGPASDTGVTGRKIVVDTYGGFARVGGGCFSGKDPTKVDRSGAYAARFLAKNIVAAALCEKAEVRLAYVIGRPKPLMQEIETFGTNKVSRKALSDFAKSILDTSVWGTIEQFSLFQTKYLGISAYGHFGRDEFPWEKIRLDRGL